MNKPTPSESFERIVAASASGEPASHPLTVAWCTLRALADDVDAWSDLADRALEPNVFLDPAFASAAVAHLPNQQVGALVVRDGKRLMGLLPGRVEWIGKGRPVSTFVAWTHPFAPLSTPLVDREYAADIVAALLDCLPDIPGRPRAALFPLLPDEGPVAQLIAAQLAERMREARQLNPHLRAALIVRRDPEESEDADAERSAKRLKELRRQRRRLADEGTLTHEIARDANAVDAALSGYLAVEGEGWKGRAHSAVSSDSAVARFFARAVTSLASEGKARIDRLKVNGRTVASTITLFSGDRAWFWKTAYDEKFARFSPGVLLALDLSDTLQDDKGLNLVDSCAVADHPMIDHLWTDRLAMSDWLVPLRGKPSAAVALASEQVRRALKRLLRALRIRRSA